MFTGIKMLPENSFLTKGYTAIMENIKNHDKWKQCLTLEIQQ